MTGMTTTEVQAQTQTTILTVENLRKQFAGVIALDGVSFQVHEREILAVLGPNGSGKTTLFNVISGFMPPSAGTIHLYNKQIGGKKPRVLVREGLARSFQQSMAFGTFTVRENLELAQPRNKARRISADELLHTCQLTDVADTPSRSLPYGSQRKLGVAIALATAPKLILLDEPGAGLSDTDTASLAEVILSLPPRGVSVACIDHNLPFLLPISDRVIVLDAGRKIFEGSPDDARKSRPVIEAYLGSYDD